MKVGMCCKEKGHGVPVRNTHVVTVECLNEAEVKGKDCSSGLMELNIVCCWNRREEYGHEENSHDGDDGTVVTYLKNCVEQ